MKIRWKHLMAAALFWIAGSVILPASCVFVSMAAEQAGKIGAQVSTESGQESDGVLMDVTCGYGGAVKGGRYTPVRLSLENKREEKFEGTLKVLSQESDGDIYQYEYPVSVSSGDTVEEIFYIPLGSRAGQLFAVLCREDGEELLRKRLKLDVMTDVTELFIGVLSDTPEQLDYLDGVGLNYGTVRTRAVTLCEEEFPGDSVGLDMFDVLLITNYDTGRLSDKQAEAVEDWVKKGGALVLGAGMRVNDVLRRFQSDLVDEPYGTPTVRQVDMGVEYAVSGPGDSYIEAPCSEVSLKGGTEVLGSDELTVMTEVFKEKGIIAVAAYDFADIAQFCRTQRSYVDKLFTTLLGEDRITMLADTLYNGNNNEYWSVQGIINTGDVKKLPRLPLYICVVLIYIVLVGPGLYLFLKKQERRRYYRPGVVAVSLLFTAIIYLMGNKTRFETTFFTYATIEDITPETVTESTYINMRTPYNKPYTVSLDPSYALRPITRSYYSYDSRPMSKFTGREDSQIALAMGQEETRVSVQSATAFSPRYFGLEKEVRNDAHMGLTGELTLFDGEISGTVTNNFDFPVENAAVLLYGQMVVLDELQPGERKVLSDLPVLNYPVGYVSMAAERVSGGYRYAETDIDSEDYMLALSRTNLLYFYLNDYLSSYSPVARIVAFSSAQSESKFLKSDGYATYGTTMLTSPVEIDMEKDGYISRQVLMRRPSIISGQYYASGNSIYGIDPVILEYSLGNDLEVSKITFDRMSEEFSENTKYQGVTMFAGNIYFYNHNTGGYDLIGGKKTEFTSEDLEAYLSPGNTLTVKYVAETDSEYNWYMTLPSLTIVGREK